MTGQLCEQLEDSLQVKSCAAAVPRHCQGVELGAGPVAGPQLEGSVVKATVARESRVLGTHRPWAVRFLEASMVSRCCVSSVETEEGLSSDSWFLRAELPCPATAQGAAQVSWQEAVLAPGRPEERRSTQPHPVQPVGLGREAGGQRRSRIPILLGQLAQALGPPSGGQCRGASWRLDGLQVASVSRNGGILAWPGWARERCTGPQFLSHDGGLCLGCPIND